MRKLLMVAATTFMFMSAQAQLNPMEPIPADKDVRIGKLENGMTYYIRHNEKPKGQADFYILHDVGAIQEADNQQGLAHFLEHMAFNGTQNLPGKMMLEYLERVGVKFGANLNAGTTWDHTQYEISDVPTNRQGIIDTAMLILHDWSHFISLLPEEIDSERGVISEELRTRDGAEWRTTIKLIKALAKGTKYEHRNLIGSLEGLRSFSYDDMRSFYHTWYRPDYQAVVIVGDIDVDKVEADLKKLMSDIPAPAAGSPSKEVIIVPDNVEPIISIFTDREMRASSANIFIKRKAMPKEANGLVVRQMQDALLYYASMMLNTRLNDISKQANAPFLGASTYNGNIGIVPTLDATSFSLTTEDGKLATGFEAMLTEIEKARRYGFTQGEFERTQENLMRSSERQYTNRNDRSNNEFVYKYISNYKTGAPIPSAEYEWKLDSMLIKMISLQDVNTVYKQLIQPNNWVIVVTAPEKDGIATPTEEELVALIAKVGASEIEAYEDNTVKEPLIANLKALKGSAVKKTATNEVFGTTEWTLKNGINIIVKPTAFKADEVRMYVKSNGGSSILSNEEFYTSQLMPGIFEMSGLGKFTATDLSKQLSGKSASIGISVDKYTHSISGYTSPKDIETTLQLLYMSFTAPRFNETDYNNYINMVGAQVANMLKNPDYIAYDKYLETLYNNNPRAQMLSPEILASVKFELVKPIFDKLYSNANNFTFTIIGNVDLTTLKPLVEKYIGSLPTNKTKLNYMDDHIDPVKGQVVNNFHAKMQQPKVSVYYDFTGEVPYTIENRMKMSFLSQALSSRYLVSIREEKGGTYGVSVRGSSEFAPNDRYSLLIQFDTNEAMQAELREIIIAELQKIANEGPLTEDVEKTREYLAKSWKNALEENGAWLEYIVKYYSIGMDYISNYENALKAITNEDIQKFAQKILADGNMVNVVMLPEAEQAQAE